MAELEDRFIKRGFWVNWSQGPIMGQTLTVEARTGILVVALLTILASAATAQLWNLFTFLFHQFRANGCPSDGLFWQHQVLLRTLPTPTAYLADAFKLSWRWRSKAPRSLLRYSLLLTFALCFAITSIAGGIATSYVVDNSNIEVLVKSSSCARFTYGTTFLNGGISDLMSNLGKTIDSYALNCYQNSSSLPASCYDTFSRSNVSFTVGSASCPWSSSMCYGEASPAVTMDSGLLNLRTHFGINMKEQDDVKFRKKTTCNVLPREGHIITRNVSYWTARGFTDNKTTLNYGSYRNTPAELRPEATFLQSTGLTDNQPTFGSDAIYSYQNPNPAYIGINPLPEMQRNDSDIALLAIWMNSVYYSGPVNDTLFSAHKPWIYVPGGGAANQTRFEPDYAAGVIGCTEQYQFCTKQGGKEDYCTQLGGSPSDTFVDQFPNLTPAQNTLLQLLSAITRMSNIGQGVLEENIKAKSMMSRGILPAVPNDQWIKEIVGWESIAWAGYQTLISAAAIGPKEFDPDADKYTVPLTEGDQQFCRSLKMRKSGGFANVNVFGLVFITTFSITVTLFNAFVLRFAIFLSKFRHALAPRIDRWIQDGVFQLQRRGFEAHGEGRWIDVHNEIPTTRTREGLEELPLDKRPPRAGYRGWLGRVDVKIDEITEVEEGSPSPRRPTRVDTETTLTSKEDVKEKEK